MRLADHVESSLRGVRPVSMTGRLTRILGLSAEAEGVHAAVGDLVEISSGDTWVPAEVVAVRTNAVQIAPLSELSGVLPGATVRNSGTQLRVAVSEDLRGRVLDGLGRPMDGLPPVSGERVSVMMPAPDALARQRITEPLPMGVRAIDSLLTCAAGQRVGIFAGSGVGKSTLLGMMARGSAADFVVIGLIGERGREVREFLEDELGPGGRERAVTVVATADAPPLVRMKAAHTATRIAEHFRDQGANVLLMVDSLTRFAMAAREVGLASGEPPATRGYPPSVFAELGRLLERTGPGSHGSITALYTVLVEGDDFNDPVSDSARSILDGHIVLSRRLAAAGHYPTIDVLNSASRLASKVTSAEHRAAANRVRSLMAALEEARDLIEIGAYAPGANPTVDEALARRERIDRLLRQDVSEVSTYEDSMRMLAEAVM